MNRRRFLTSLATGAAVAATARLAASDDLTVKLPYSPTPKPKPLTFGYSHDVDFNVLLWAIAERETGFHGLDDRHLVGKKCGSRSRYQISEAVWKQHNTAVHGRFDRDCHGNAANWLAFRHLRWLDTNIPRRGVMELTQREWSLAWAWHGGLSSWLDWERIPIAKFQRCADYAESVQNLFRDRLRSLSA